MYHTTGSCLKSANFATNLSVGHIYSTTGGCLKSAIFGTNLSKCTIVQAEWEKANFLVPTLSVATKCTIVQAVSVVASNTAQIVQADWGNVHFIAPVYQWATK